MKVLNLYAGLGGNRKNWENCEVTAVESNSEIAEVYQKLNPDDEVIVGDAHEYLLNHYSEFDFIWSSPPCQSHSKMIRSGRNQKPRFPDMALYEEILFLKYNFKGEWIVENVVPYYEPLVAPTQKIGRHLFWGSFDFNVSDVPRPPGFINLSNALGRKSLMDWLGIHYDKNIYYSGNHCPAQVLRNCVHPLLGNEIFKSSPLFTAG
jgi:DNA (cytosine-5)-methyltransferase 1